MTAAVPSPDSDNSFSRAIALWRDEQTREAPSPEAGERGYAAPERERPLMGYAPYAIALTLALGVGAAAASLATAPALTDSIEMVAAVDARQMGMATNLDPTGAQKKAATLSRDVGSLKSEIARLQKALDQSRSNQAALTKQTAGQAASNQDEVKSLKGEIANLQKTLEATRESSANKIEQLSARVEKSKDDAAHVAELRERLDRVEKQASVEKARPVRETERRAEAAPETTGSLGRDVPAPAPVVEQPEREAKARSDGEPDARTRDAGGQIVRNWTVREVVRGVALLEGRHGMIEVVRGARAPGMGRIRSIERRDGQWVVVTDRGLVIERNEL